MVDSFRFGFQPNLNHEIPEIKSLSDRFKHTYIIGKTGMGKSSVMERMALYDLQQGLSVIYIDPKGESCRRLYELANDNVKYISIENPTIINPLNKEGYRLDTLIQEFIQIMDVLVTLTASNPESTVLMREIIGMAMRAITKEEDKNIAYLTNLFLYKAERNKLVGTLEPGTEEHRYWKEFDEVEANRFPRNKDKIESAKRIASRLIEISTGEMTNFVIGKNEFDLENLVQSGVSALVDTSRMNRNSRIYLTNLIVYAVLSYSEYAEKKDKPLLIYVDEFQIVVSPLFSDLLARSRGSNVGFTIAHQSFGQLPEKILDDIFAIVGSIVALRCGDKEATRLANIFDISPRDLFDLDEFSAWLRLGRDNILVDLDPPILDYLPDRPQSTINPTVKDNWYLGDEWVII